jgi:mRNA interferase MazF
MARPGELWLAAIPYTSGAASKLRPVLILWEDAVDVVVSTVTTAPPRSATDVSLKDWQSEGLRAPSTVRLLRLDCLERLVLRRQLGRLTLADAQRLQAIWADKVQLRF